jgi:hypothetical protein
MARDRIQLHSKNYDRARALLDATSLQVYRSRVAALYAELGYLLYDRYDMIEARVSYRRALERERLGKYYTALAKTYIPAPLLKALRDKL